MEQNKEKELSAALLCGDPSAEVKTETLPTIEQQVEAQNIALHAPYFCHKNHPLENVAWDGNWRYGTCECGRVLAWSGKGR